MREIKFRIYDKAEKRMKFLDSIWNMPDPSYDFDEIQQFTGLLDKHGKEIYEGDIVITQDKLKYEVVFDQGSYKVKTGSGNYNFYPQYSEIIGNIYENPDLLK